MAKFGEVDWTIHTASADAEERVREYETKFGFRQNSSFVHRYMAPIDVEPTEYERIYRGEWERTICKHRVIEQGYIAVLDSERGLREFHARSIHEALLAVARAQHGLEGLRKPIHESKHFSRAMARSLGWCDPGINQWVSDNLAGKVRRLEGEDTVPIKVLWGVISQKTNRNQYEDILYNLLQGHPEIDDGA